MAQAHARVGQRVGWGAIGLSSSASQHADTRRDYRSTKAADLLTRRPMSLSMTAFRLPKTSKIRPRILRRAMKHDARVRRFRIYRYEPAPSLQPSLDTYELDAGAYGPMVLVALI